MSSRPASEIWHEAAQRWVDAEAAANLLEETKSAILSQMMSRSNATSVAAKELSVKAGQEWYQYVERIAAARKAANKAKVEAEFLKMVYWERQSVEANHRAEARL